MRLAYALIGLLATGAAVAQPIFPLRPAPALSPAQRTARIGTELKPFAGRPLAGPFKVGPGLPVPSQVNAFGMEMVRTVIADSSGGLAQFLETTVKTAVDIQRPMVTVTLKPHAKPYLADCSLSTDESQQVAYYDASEPTYESKVMEKKSVVSIQDGHALFAIAPATTQHMLYVGPVTLNPAKAWSMGFYQCEFSQVG